MEFKHLIERAILLRKKYSALELQEKGREWTRAQLMEGFVGDVGDLMKIVMTKEGVRSMKNVDEKLAHELSDCLWCILVLADKYNVDIEKAFLDTMMVLEKRIDDQTK